MSRTTSSRAVVVFLLLSALALPAWATDTKGATDQVVEGAKKVGQGVEDTAKGIGKTVTEGAKDVEQRAQKAAGDPKPVGDKLHDSAKGFGEALLDGIKYAGRTVYNFFSGK